MFQSTFAPIMTHGCGIIPPHVFEHIARSARDPYERRIAEEALLGRHQIREHRSQVQANLLQAPQRTAAGVAAVKRRRVLDARGTLPIDPTGKFDFSGARVVRQEADPVSADTAVNEAYDYSGTTWDFYHQVFGRNSVDDAGLELVSVVHLDQRLRNAMWDGEEMVYADASPGFFNRFTIALDVVGHELTHGVTQFTAALEYRSQSGALNESISDVFGSMIKQKNFNQTVDQADWLIGVGLFVQIPGRNRTALRSMSDPGTAFNDPGPDGVGVDPQPSDMSGYQELRETRDGDFGGVHINSGIPNRAFFLVAKALGGSSWEKAGRIWYKVLTEPLIEKNAQFSDMRKATITAAESLFSSREAQIVSNAWSTVGVN
jgi:Zn-dependent metalloprotease